MHGRQGFATVAGRSIQSLDAKRNSLRGFSMTLSRSATLWLGLATAFPVIYLAGFIPIFFFLQDSPNPPVGRDMEHVLFLIAGFAMASYFVAFLGYLVHSVACYRGGIIRKVAWTLGFIVAGPFAMVPYWLINVRCTAAPVQPGPRVGV
jgi:bacteriorhodopsin